MCQQEMEVEVTDVDEEDEEKDEENVEENGEDVDNEEAENVEEGDQERLSCADCALQAPRREIHSNDVCGAPMDLAINMVIGSGDCFIEERDDQKEADTGVELPVNHIL